MKKGDKLRCLNTIKNVFHQPLFLKGEIYEVLYIDTENIKTYVTLNHILYANEYMEYELEWVEKNFKIVL
jgi:hypothetical protein